MIQIIDIINQWSIDRCLYTYQADFANASANATESEHKVAFDKDTENHVQIPCDNQDAKATNASSATLQTSLDEEQEPDPSLVKTTEYLNNLQEAEQARIQKSKNKSKLAEMAETNLSGYGIIPGKGESEK